MDEIERAKVLEENKDMAFLDVNKSSNEDAYDPEAQRQRNDRRQAILKQTIA